MKALALALALATTPLAAAERLPVVQLSAGMHLIRAEVAADMGSRMQGLMYRRSLGQNEGMLFIFEERSVQCMWMKNTLVPLSVAFMDEQGTILNIADMQPHSEESHCSKGPARLALEMNRGWFAQRGIQPGMRIGGLEKLRR